MRDEKSIENVTEIVKEALEVEPNKRQAKELHVYST